MGKVWDYLNYGMSKEEWERQQLIGKLREKDFCSECGKRTQAICQMKVLSGLFGSCEEPLCLDCAKKCKKCGKYFCSNHIHNHSCN